MDKFDQEKTDKEMLEKMQRKCGFIADFAFDRGERFTTFGRWKKIGQLFYDFDHSKPSILMRGMRTGTIVATPYDKIEDHPFIQGDIEIPIPSSSRDGSKASLWVGYVFTETKQNGATLYVATIEVDPWPLVIARRFRQFEKKVRDGEDSHIQNGLWLYIKEEQDGSRKTV
jgi:hypothetical protein